MQSEPRPCDLALDVNHGLVDRIAEVGAGVAAHDEASGLRHEGAHVPDRPADDDVDALHRDPASRTGVALDHDEPAVAGRARPCEALPFTRTLARHDVLGEPGPAWPLTVTGALVHARAVIPDVALDANRHGHAQARGDRVLALRADHAPRLGRAVRRERVERGVQLAHRRRLEVDRLHDAWLQV